MCLTCGNLSCGRKETGGNAHAIEHYKKISDQTIYETGIPIEAIYFIEKRIKLSKRYKLHSPEIYSLIDMGGCFEKISTQKAMNTSKRLKEEAKKVYEDNLQSNNNDSNIKNSSDLELKNFIYTKLMSLYSDLANKQENLYFALLGDCSQSQKENGDDLNNWIQK